MIKQVFFSIVIFFCLAALSCSTREGTEKIWVEGVNSPEISLNGTWKFTMNPPQNFWEKDVDFAAWDDIQVPGECQMQGFAIKHDQPYIYKSEIDIPADYEGKDIFIDFHGVYSYARVWINGHFIREHFGGFTRWTCDITKHVDPGKKAIITVEIIDRIDDISYGSGYAKHQIGGILRKVVLKAMPEQHFEQLFFETDFDENYKNADLNISYELSMDSPASLRLDTYDPHNKLVSSERFEDIKDNDMISVPFINPEKWDAEHPNLYTVIVSLYAEGKEVLRIPQKIGFRKVSIDGNKLLVNGSPVKLRGACRHDIHPLLGRMTSEEYDKQDVLLAKEANMNFIRTSHYPPSEAFLDYCDEYGIYVEDETAVCFVGSHRTFDYQESGATQNLDKYTNRYLSQLEEMVDHHRNHPSVIIWSIGNENVFGSNFIKSYRWIKEADPSRPVIYSYPGPVPDSVRNYEILSMHYPDWEGNLNQYGIETKGFSYSEMPVLFDEWAHVACYNNPTLRYDPNVRNFWGESLDLMWGKLFESDGGLGGAIWCMIDETFMLPEDLEGYNQWWGKLDPNVIPATYMGPTVGYGEWGIIDTWRRKKPEFWSTKKAYSPTKILTTNVDNFSSDEELILPVNNRFDHTNFDELIILYEYAGNSGIIKDINLEPHEKGELNIPAQKWKNDTELKISFFDQAEKLIDTYEIQIGMVDNQVPKLRSGVLNISEGNGIVYLEGEKFSLEIDKTLGFMRNIISDGDTLIKSGPYINLKLPGKRVQYSTLQMDDYAQNWKCKEVEYSVSEGILKVNTHGSYDLISASFEIKFDEEGLFFVDYKFSGAPSDKMVQEMGLYFYVGDNFEELSWKRDPYFTAYPMNDLGSAEGAVEINYRPPMDYRVKPKHDWIMDSKNFYYHGIDVNLPYTNLVRSMKEQVFSFQLNTGSSSLGVLSDGRQACKFDKIDGKNVLIINDQWDYQSLLWGNYMKMIDSVDKFEGHVVLKIDKK